MHLKILIIQSLGEFYALKKLIEKSVSMYDDDYDRIGETNYWGIIAWNDLWGRSTWAWVHKLLIFWEDREGI